MKTQKRLSRRAVIKTGLVALTTSAFLSRNALASTRPKAPGETLVVYLGGDQLHNFIEQENTIRGVCGKAGWRVMSTYDNYSVTPELLSETDLFIYTRWGGFVGKWYPSPIRDSAEPDPRQDYSYDALLEAVMDNVINRGMGFMSLHCTIAHLSKPKFCEFMGIRPMMHGPVQTVRCHNFNPNHPISKGLPDFNLAIDENFGVELINKNVIPLYESTGQDDKRHDIAGWCYENGKGRIVGLAAGHTYTSWRHPIYHKLYWRGAHWALKKEIPEADM